MHTQLEILSVRQVAAQMQRQSNRHFRISRYHENSHQEKRKNHQGESHQLGTIPTSLKKV